MNAFNEYVRLVESGSEDDFIDVDTSLIIEYRDEIEDSLKKGVPTEGQREKLNSTDKLFRLKVAACAETYKKIIARGDSNGDYIKMLLDSIRYPNMHDSNRWWFHLID